MRAVCAGVEDVITSRLFIEPEYRCNVIGENEYFLKILQETYQIKVYFETLSGDFGD